jgi:hypothetical protein
LKGGPNGSAAVLIATRHHLHAPMVRRLWRQIGLFVENRCV